MLKFVKEAFIYHAIEIKRRMPALPLYVDSGLHIHAAIYGNDLF